MTLRVGLTGAIGAGKSLALDAFAAAGAETHSADAVAHALARPGGPIFRAIIGAFGRGILSPDGTIDRRRLGAMAFRDARVRRRLERASQPHIRRELARRMARAARPVVVADIPLLFEKGLEGGFDLTVCVTAPLARRLGRVARRDGLSRTEILRRVRAQWPEAQKAQKADVVIFNAGSRAALRRAAGEYQRAFALIAAGLGGSR